MKVWKKKLTYVLNAETIWSVTFMIHKMAKKIPFISFFITQNIYKHTATFDYRKNS